MADCVVVGIEQGEVSMVVDDGETVRGRKDRAGDRGVRTVWKRKSRSGPEIGEQERAGSWRAGASWKQE